MLGFHFQKPVKDWPEAAKLFPDGIIIKAIDNVQMLREAKAINPKFHTNLRHHVNHLSLPAQPDQMEAAAKAFFDTFIDGTFRNHAAYVDTISEGNEYFGNHQDPAERTRWVQWATACARVWERDFRSQPDYRHIRLVLAETAVGNDIPIEVARAAQTYDCLLGYHPYVVMANRKIMPAEIEWKYYSGRWTQMDAVYQQHGIYVDWFFGESGPVEDMSGERWQGRLNPKGGWRHKNVCNGDMLHYLDMIDYWCERTQAWNLANGNRALGGVLFTSGGGETWKWFETKQPEMNLIASHVAASYPPNLRPSIKPPTKPPVEPPPVDPPEPPTPPSGNLLKNGDFSSRNWTTLPGGNQQPEHWHIAWLGPDEPDADRTPEMVHRTTEELPPHEHPGGSDPLILEGDAVYKAFTVNGRVQFTLSQTAGGFEPAQPVRLVGHLRCHYHTQKNESDHFEMYVDVNDYFGIYNADDFPDREWMSFALDGVADANGNVSVQVNVQNNYPDRIDWFFDAFSLTVREVEPEPIPPTKINHTVHLLPQDTTVAELQAVTAALHPARSGFTYSADFAHAVMWQDPAREHVHIWDGERWSGDIFAWFAERGIGTIARSFAELSTGEPVVPPPALPFAVIVDELPKHPDKSYGKRPLSDIDTIVVHHSAVDADISINSIAAYHVNSNGWPGIGYHFCIEEDGGICQVNELTTRSYHAGGHNNRTVGICLLGSFQNESPTDIQLKALDWLIGYLLGGELAHVEMVLPHRALNQTACPGNTVNDWWQWGEW